MDKIEIDGLEFSGTTVELLQGKLLIIQGKTGMLGCGYFNLAGAATLGSAMAIVSGVKCYDDMRAATVAGVSAKAAEAGVKVGMSGREALLIMK